MSRPTNEAEFEKLRNRSSTYEFMKSNQTLVMEHQIAVEHEKILRAQLRECVLREFENSKENCLELRMQYADLLNDRFYGMIFPAGMEPENRVKARKY
jgi:hypothetical protein